MENLFGGRPPLEMGGGQHFVEIIEKLCFRTIIYALLYTIIYK